MSAYSRISFYIAGIITTLVSVFVLVQLPYEDAQNFIYVLPIIVVSVVIFARPLWGIFLVLLLQPFKTFGSEILLFVKLVGLIVVVITFLRSLYHRERIDGTGLEAPIYLIGLGMSLSLFRSSDIQMVVVNILSLASLYGLLLVIVNLISNQTQLQKLVLIFLASGIYPILQAFIQGSQPNPNLTFSRVRGTFAIPTGLGGFLIPIVILSAALLFYPGFSARRRWLILGIFAGGFLAITLTLSRGAIIGLFAGMFVLFLLLNPNIRYKRKTTILIFALGAVVIWSLWPSFEGRVIKPIVDALNGGATVENITSRYNELSLLIPITVDNFFMGTGIGNYTQAALRYRILYNMPNLPSVPHNVFLYFFGEVGIIAAIGFIWMCLRVIKNIASSYDVMKSSSNALIFYVYIASLSSLVGYLPFIITHNGFYQNELWMALAFFIVSLRLKLKSEYETNNSLPGQLLTY